MCVRACKWSVARGGMLLCFWESRVSDERSAARMPRRQGKATHFDSPCHVEEADAGCAEFDLHLRGPVRHRRPRHRKVQQLCEMRARVHACVCGCRCVSRVCELGVLVNVCICVSARGLVGVCGCRRVRVRVGSDVLRACVHGVCLHV